jgi:putative nucleotidyltransferase with HDIG domain
MKLSVDELIREAGELPPMPQVAQRALGMIREEEASAVQLAEVLSVEQVLTGLLLRNANSAYYGMQNRILTVNQAIVVMGMNAVRELLLASSVVSYLYRPLPGYELRRGELWRHSLGVAIGARFLMERRNKRLVEEAYYAGLLCDIGKLAFEKLIRRTDTFTSDWLEHSFLDKEQEVFGLNHAALGAEMAARWGLPDVLAQVIANHHTPSQAAQKPEIASAVHLSDMTLMMMGIGLGKDGLRYPLDPFALECLKITQPELDMLFIQVMSQIQLADLFVK